MKIETKLSIHEYCYFVEDSRIKSGQITQINVSVLPFDTLIEYRVSRYSLTIQLSEEHIFKTVDEALDYLKENVQ